MAMRWLKDQIRPLAIRWGWIPKPEPFGVEKSSEYYDKMYSLSEEYRLDYQESRYYFMWSVVIDRLRRAPGRRILEIGCGAGQLARFLFDQGFSDYTGLDWSPVAIEAARRTSPEGRFLVGDARTDDVFVRHEYDVVVCLEFLEHIEADLRVISRFRPGARCLCSVPSFPHVSHVRRFSDAHEVQARYGEFFTDLDVLSLRMPGNGSLLFHLFDGTRNNHCLTVVDEPARNGAYSA